MGLALLLSLLALPAFAAPTFPALSGRVVDEANVLSPQVESDLTSKLQDLETKTGRQLVVVTLPSLQGYEIEDYGYQLGRTWGIGEKGKNDGVLFIVAPNEHKVRIEVGYGLEPVLTDALSSVILQQSVIPKFKSGDIEGGVTAGTDALIAQLALPEGEAKQRVAAAEQRQRSGGQFPGWAAIVVGLFLFFMLSRLFGGRRRGYGGGGMGSALPWIVLGALSNRGGRDWGGGGGGGFGGGLGGGGGFSGGGGSFGGGGSSGSW